jgi:glycosyltransferase involved in cell wall biosynthesis/phosphatidylglycerophosphate synthase
MKYTMKDVIKSYTPDKRKKTSIWARIFSRPLSFLVTYVLINLGFTANMVSIISIFEAMLACSFLIIGGSFLPIGIALFLFWDILDCTDGNIARVKGTSSLIGEYMDAISGYTAPAYIYLSVGVAAYRTTYLFPEYAYWFVILGGIASISDILSRIIYQKYVVTEYRIGMINNEGNIDENRATGIKHVADLIMKNMTYSCLFMPLLVIAYFTSWFDILVFLYAVYSFSILICTFIYFIRKAYALERKVNSNAQYDINNLKYRPLITILIPVCNGANFVSDAIDSALAQTYDNFEILVINDGSTDNTEEILSSYGNKIRYISKQNGGVSTALNTGIQNMHGEWLSWLSHDDKYLPDKLLKQVIELNRIIDEGIEDVQKIILYCSNERIDINGDYISRKKHLYKKNESLKETMLNNIKHYNICGCAALIPKKAFDEVGEFRTEIPTCSDADMWYRMMFAGYKFIFMNEVLVQSRQHQGQVSKRKEQQCKVELSDLHCQIAKKMLKLLDAEDDIWRLECYLIERGFDDAARIVSEEYNSRFNKKHSVRQRVQLFFYRYKHKVRNVLRAVYRNITSK